MNIKELVKAGAVISEMNIEKLLKAGAVISIENKNFHDWGLQYDDGGCYLMDMEDIVREIERELKWV